MRGTSIQRPCHRMLSVGLIALAAVWGSSARAGRGQEAGRVLAAYDFADSAQGWRISGDTIEKDAIFELDGAPGGCITGVDEAIGETWYFRAPREVIDRLPAAAGGTLAFSLRQSGQILSLIDDDVVIVGRTGRLGYRFNRMPG